MFASDCLGNKRNNPTGPVNHHLIGWPDQTVSQPPQDASKKTKTPVRIQMVSAPSPQIAVIGHSQGDNRVSQYSVTTNLGILY